MTDSTLTPSQEAREAAEYRVEMVEDRPTSGMWHCGPNAAWVTVTHLPTMISARAFDQSHHKAKQAAQACCEMMVEQSRLLKCRFPERVQTDEQANRKDEAEKLRSEVFAVLRRNNVSERCFAEVAMVTHNAIRARHTDQTGRKQ